MKHPIRNQLFIACGAAPVQALLVGTLVLGSAGCELIGQIQQRSLASAISTGDSGSPDATTSDAGSPDSGGGDAGSGGVATGLSHCKVPSSGSGLVRFGNLVPNTDRVDVCLRPSSASSFASVTPLFASSGATCAPGLGYKDVTISLGIAPDSYEVRVIPAGQGCDSAPIATMTTALVQSNSPIALHLFGNGQQAPSLRKYAESRPSQSGSAAMRLYNMAEPMGPLDFGLASSGTLPSTIRLDRIQNLAFGEATPNDPSQTAIDANGYVVQQSGSGKFAYAVAPGGTKTGILAVNRTITAGSAFSFFTTGRTDTPDFPLELFACDETTTGTSVLASCSDAPPVTFTIDTVDLQLSGPFSGAEAARRPVGIATVANLDSDVICVTEIYQPADTAALIAAAKTKFPYSYVAAMDENMPATDPTNLAGQTPQLPTTPPCASSTTGMNSLVDCIRDNCSTVSGDDTAVAIQNPTSCISKSCTGPIVNLISGTPDDVACWACVFSNYDSYETMGSMRTRCTTDPRGGVGFRGEGATMILSRVPLTNTSYFRMPAGGAWMTTAVKATATLDNGASVDIACAAGSSVMEDCTLFPTVSPWGEYPDGGPAPDCVQSSFNTQTLTNMHLRDWIEKSSGAAGSKLILSGDFYTGPSYKDQVQALHPENFAILSSVFSVGTSTTFIPECTNCVDNTMRTAPGGTPSGLNTWTRFNFLQNIPITAVQSNKVFLKEDVVDGGPGNGATSVPISTYYAFRSVLSIAP